MTRLAGKVAFITGGASGLGRVGAERFAAEGARVVIADVGDASQTLQAIARAGGTAASVTCDVSSDASVRDAVAFAVETFGDLHVLYNNAGVMMNPFGLTKDGYESQHGINHLGHYLLTLELMPLLEAGQPSRVVSVSSAAHAAQDPPSHSTRSAPALP
jgi:NAD(P)-dependent dehydrogenase (short-subunit alcohol dehydrogenase family)